MFSQWRAARRARKRVQDQEKKLAQLPGRFPGFNWAPFDEVCRFFGGKSISAFEDQVFLYQLCTELPPDAQVIEIGSWIGQSACVIGQALRGSKARCYAIDTFSVLNVNSDLTSYYRDFLAKAGTQKSQRELFDEHVAHFGLQEKVIPVVAESSQAASLLPAGFPGADLIFIDGGHTLEAVRSDIELYLPLIHSGGIVAFHDFTSECGVPQAVWEAIQRGSFSHLIGMRGCTLAFRKS